jgi:hypothetical protein
MRKSIVGAYHAAFAFQRSGGLEGGAARRAAIRAMSPDERAKWDRDMAAGFDVAHEHRERALKAAKLGRRRIRPPRWRKPEPEKTRRYCQQINMDAVLDPRMSPGAARCLVLIVSECGRYKERLLCNGYLGGLLDRSPRQVQRYVSELTELGYITCRPQIHPETKCTTGRHIKPSAKCFPYWHPDGPGEPNKPLSHWNKGRDTDAPHEISKSKNLFIERKLSTGPNPAEDPRRRDPVRYIPPIPGFVEDEPDIGKLSRQEIESRYGWGA